MALTPSSIHLSVVSRVRIALESPKESSRKEFRITKSSALRCCSAGIGISDCRLPGSPFLSRLTVAPPIQLAIMLTDLVCSPRVSS